MDRLKEEGRLKPDAASFGSKIIYTNTIPLRPEKDLLRDYVRMVDYLYEPSRFMSRAYRYVLGIRPTRAALAWSNRSK